MADSRAIERACDDAADTLSIALSEFKASPEFPNGTLLIQAAENWADLFVRMTRAQVSETLSKVKGRETP